jgi:hypothetical protein
MINDKYRRVVSKTKGVPLVLKYDIEIQLASENEIAKCSQKILSFLFNYMYFNVDYFGMKIDAVFLLPDDKTIEIPREIKMDTERKKTIKFSLDVETYYPIFQVEFDDLIVCDNDDKIDWATLGVPKPSMDFEETIKAYNKNYNMNSGAVDGTGEIKKVMWDVYFHELQNLDNKTTTRIKEDFNVYPNVAEYIKQRDISNEIDDNDLEDGVDDE